MSEKILNSRIVHKHDSGSNWNKAINFVPKQGELIIYDKDETHNYVRLKVGDGTSNVNDLPFIDETKVDKVDGKQLSTNDYTTEEKNKLAGIEAGANKTVVDDTLSSTSENPVQNKVVNAAISNLNTLVGDTPVSNQIENAISSLESTYVVLQDRVSGYNYLLEMINGKLVSSCCCCGIAIYTMPTKTTYFEGESIDTSGMSVIAICEDGSTKNIEWYDMSYKMELGENEVVVSYTERGNTYTTTFTINVVSSVGWIDDFVYTTESDGTYTLTGWNETVNGESSTKCMIPDSDLINL